MKKNNGKVTCRGKGRLYLTVLTGMATLFGMSVLRADQAITSYSDYNVVALSPFTLGYSFTVGSQSLTASALGAFYNGTAYTYSHPIGVWDSTGSLIATATVPSGTPSQVLGNFAYVDLPSPILLDSGSTYTVGTLYPVGTEANGAGVNGEAILNPDITLGSWLYAASTTLQKPDTTSTESFGAANIEISPVPEPASWGGLAMSLAFAAALARRAHGKRAGQ